jgi:DNA-binding YbaB/EbfC family protein
MKNIAGLMKQASQMQEKMKEMQARLESAELEGTSGAGLVRLVLTGKGTLKSITVDPKLADPAETEMLQDLILAAHADAKSKLDAFTESEMKNATGGLQLPAGMKLPF